MHFTRGKSALVRATALAYRRLKYAVAAPVVSAVMTYTPWPDGGDAPPKALNYSADGDFVAQGDELVETLQRDFALDGGERILDIAAGSGALPRVSTAPNAMCAIGVLISSDTTSCGARKRCPRARVTISPMPVSLTPSIISAAGSAKLSSSGSRSRKWRWAIPAHSGKSWPPRIAQVNRGSWRGEQGLRDYQDCLIFEKV